MYDRTYGSSPYRPVHALRSPEPHKKAPDWMNKFKGWKPNRWLKGAMLLAALLLMGFWFFLGDFRFLMFRYPSLSGFPFGNRTYLVLFQNNYELRPTGGFISNYAELTFSHGLYTGIEFHDVYAEIDEHPYVEPPLVLGTLLKGPNYQGHTFRDANEDPDFNISRDKLIEFYQLTHPDTRIDGVIAADFSFLEQWVAQYEPLTVDGRTLTEANLFETLSATISDVDLRDENALASRKDIAAPLANKLINKTLIFPWRIRSFLNMAAQGFHEKHLLASFTRRPMAKSFAYRNWDGALPQSDLGDVLAINEANYGGMKSNRYITRDVQYELDVTGAKDILGNPVLKATVSVTLSHEGTWNVPLSGAYTGYLRVMIPKGADIEEGGDVTEKREDLQTTGDLIKLQPGESVTYTYSYELPEYVWNDGTYFLHLHKQPGTQGDPYRVVVRVPQGMSLESPNFDVRENLGIWESPLVTDQNLSFTLLPDKTGPRVVLQEITDLNEITLVFNEALNEATASDLDSYTFVGEELTLQGMRVEGNTVTLTTEGMKASPGQSYVLTLQNIADRAGNLINPSPRTVTLIQPQDLVAPVETPAETLTPENNG